MYISEKYIKNSFLMDFKIISDIGALLLKRIMKTTVL